jgi:hypothetical protein
MRCRQVRSRLRSRGLDRVTAVRSIRLRISGGRKRTGGSNGDCRDEYSHDYLQSVFGNLVSESVCRGESHATRPGLPIEHSYLRCGANLVMMLVAGLRSSADVGSFRRSSGKSPAFALIVALTGYRCGQGQQSGDTRSYSARGRTCTRRTRCYRCKSSYAERLTWLPSRRNRKVHGIRIDRRHEKHHSTNGH